MAQRIPDSELGDLDAVDILIDTELQDWMHRRRQETDVFVVALSPEDMSQHLEERWLEETLAELGLTDFGFPA